MLPKVISLPKKQRGEILPLLFFETTSGLVCPESVFSEA
jgi:hypothetical protein